MVSAVIDMGANIKNSKQVINLISGAVANFYEAVLKELTVLTVTRRLPAKRALVEEPVDNPENHEVHVAPDLSVEPPGVEVVSKPMSAFFRILPIRERRYLDKKYN